MNARDGRGQFAFVRDIVATHYRDRFNDQEFDDVLQDAWLEYRELMDDFDPTKSPDPDAYVRRWLPKRLTSMYRRERGTESLRGEGPDLAELLPRNHHWSGASSMPYVVDARLGLSDRLDGAP